MVHIDKVKRGLADFIEAELLPKMEAADSWLIGVAATLLISELDGVMKSLNENKLIRAMHIIHDDGSVNIEKLYPVAMEHIRRTGHLKMDFPLVGAITLDEHDLEHLYRRIMQI